MDTGNDKHNKEKNKKIKHPKKPSHMRWVVTITILSFIISVTLSYTSTIALESATIVVAFSILILFILVGILFDIIGVAATASTEKQFHSMAARKVVGASQAVWLTRNASKVGSFCNDVIGDISGIISGATGALIIARIASDGSIKSTLISLAITGAIAAFTIGGKAIGKSIGISNCTNIIFFTGKMIYYFTLQPFRKNR